MKSTLLTFLALAFLATFSHGQTKAVIKNITGNTVTESLSFPSGTTLTIAAGATINATGATITGFGSGGGPTALDDLTDVTITSATTGQILRYNGTAWVNYTHGFLTSSDLSGYATTAAVASGYQPINADLTALSGLTSAADRLPYYTGAGTAALATFTSAARSLLDDSSVAVMRGTLGIGTMGTQNANSVSISGGSISGVTFSTLTSTVGVTIGNDGVTGGELIIINGNGTTRTTITPGANTDITLGLPVTGTGLLSDTSNLPAANLTGSIADARLSANVSLLGQAISLTAEVTGTLPIANGGTGATTAADARIALLPSMVGNGGKFLRVNAGATDYEVATISGGGDALTSGTLAQFAATTSAQLRGVLSDESGTGEFLTTTGSAAGLTSFPTLNQSTTGNAATATALQTARTINGTSFDGSANITVTAAADTLTGTTLASGVTASSLTSAAGGSFGTAAYTAATAYEVPLTFSTGLTRTGNTVTVNTSQSLSVLSNLTTNGFVKTSGGTGTLSIDTATYQVSDADLDDLADGSLTGTAVAAASTTARGSVELATDGETSASVAVQGNDNRLADAEKIEIGVACSDETTAVTTGTAKVTFRAPYAFTLTAVRASTTTANTGSTLVIDINESGTTVLSTKLSLDASEKTSTTAATAAVISDTAIADDAEITIDFDQVGSTIAGAGVKVWLIGTR